MIKNILSIAIAGIVLLYFIGRKNSIDNGEGFERIDTIPAETEVNIDSIKKVMKIINYEVFISVYAGMKNNYSVPVYFLLKPENKILKVLLKIKDTEFHNELYSKYIIKFSMGFDLTENMNKYYQNGHYNIPALQGDIKVIAKELIEKQDSIVIGNFKSAQIDSLNNMAMQIAEDSLQYYLFKVKIINQRPVITHRKL